MVVYVLVAVAGFLAGTLLATTITRCSVGKRRRSAAAKAKEFTQFMIISDNTILWYMCVAYTGLAAYSIYKNYVGSLPWLTGGLGLAFAAWATIQSFLIKKSERQNTVGGITYDTAMQRLSADGNQSAASQDEAYTVDENNRDC